VPRRIATLLLAQVLYTNATGIENTVIGVNALYNNVTNYNTAVGYGALADNNSSGQSNTAVGIGVLAKNQTGFETLPPAVKRSIQTRRIPTTPPSR